MAASSVLLHGFAEGLSLEVYSSKYGACGNFFPTLCAAVMHAGPCELLRGRVGTGTGISCYSAEAVGYEQQCWLEDNDAGLGKACGSMALGLRQR
jgi:hypothetical protein